MPAPPRTAWVNPRFHCKTGQNCRIRRVCQTGFAWNSYACGGLYDQYWWFNGCQALADQVAAEQQLMGMTNDAGESMRYQMLANQYDACLSRYGGNPFSSYLFMSELDPFYGW